MPLPKLDRQQAESIGYDSLKEATPLKSGTSVRVATEENVGELIELFREGDAYHADALPHIFREATSRPAAAVAQLIAAPGQRVLLAYEAGSAVGFVHGRLVNDDPSTPFTSGTRLIIESLVVDAGARRHGVGRKLMEEIEAWGRSHGARRADLHVWAFNVPATRLYETLGYDTLGLRMSKPLTASHRTLGADQSPSR